MEAIKALLDSDTRERCERLGREDDRVWGDNEVIIDNRLKRGKLGEGNAMLGVKVITSSVGNQGRFTLQAGQKVVFNDDSASDLLKVVVDQQASKVIS